LYLPVKVTLVVTLSSRAEKASGCSILIPGAASHCRVAKVILETVETSQSPQARVKTTRVEAFNSRAEMPPRWIVVRLPLLRGTQKKMLRAAC
jgi:hypothetical protein